MSSEQPIETSPLVTSTQLTGRVKWFNNKAGYGFITGIDGANAGSDIFVHHSRIVVNNEQYKYLVQGEYVGFNLEHTPGQTHEFQAGTVSGVNGGNLMCETRREFRQNRIDYSKNSESEQAAPVETKTPRSTRPPPTMQRQQSTHSNTIQVQTPRSRGAGPRDGTEPSEWTMVTPKGRNAAAGRGAAGRGASAGRGATGRGKSAGRGSTRETTCETNA
jgi:CspA family cold shock protein